jgi:proteic killer suppression protein
LRFDFHSKKLAVLYFTEKGSHKYPAGVIAAFFNAMTIIEAARDIRDLYAFKSLHFEQLAGKRKDERSIRLNDQYRLTMLLIKEKNGNYLIILNIEDYH